MDQTDAEHLRIEIRIIGQSVLQKIIDAARSFNTGEPTPANHECQKRRTILLGAIGARLLEMLDQPVAQNDRVSERLHGNCSFQETGYIVKICHATYSKD